MKIVVTIITKVEDVFTNACRVIRYLYDDTVLDDCVGLND